MRNVRSVICGAVVITMMAWGGAAASWAGNDFRRGNGPEAEPGGTC